jgi:hypothetical protein
MAIYLAFYFDEERLLKTSGSRITVLMAQALKKGYWYISSS